MNRFIRIFISITLFMMFTFEINAQESIFFKLVDTIDLKELNRSKEISNATRDIILKEDGYKKIPRTKLTIPYTTKTLVIKVSPEKKTAPFIFNDNLTPGDFILLDNKLKIINSYGFNDSENIGFFPMFKTPRGDFYILRNSNIRFDDRVRFITKEDVSNYNNINLIMSAFILGASFFLILYHLGNYVITKDKSFLFYIIFNSVYIVIILGFCLVFFRMFKTTFVAENLMFFSGLAGPAISLFGRTFLKLKDYLTKSQMKLIYSLEYFMFIPTLPYLFVNDEARIILNYIIDISVNVMVLNLIYRAYSIRKANVMANFYLASWISLFSGIFFTYAYEYLGMFSDYFFIRYSLLVGCAGEMIINSFGLAYKVKLLEKEKTIAKLEAREKRRYQRSVKLLSHDIRNYLSAIKIDAQSLGEGSNKECVESERILNSVKSIQGIIKNVREHEYARSQEKQITLGKDLYRELYMLYESRLKEKGLEFEFKGREKIEIPERKSLLVNHIVGNVLDNAIKFSHPDSKITLECQESKDAITLSVLDTGVGMSEETLNQLESGLAVSEEGTLKEAGTGLGLCIVKELMNELNGVFSIESTQDIETKIFLAFPKY